MLAGTVLLPASGATAARDCGRPEEAPGFETPARHSVVPDAICMDLQLAQDKVEAAGFNEVDSADASGKNRRQFADRNWTVVGQRPDPGGEQPKSTRITLSVVKDGESRSCR